MAKRAKRFRRAYPTVQAFMEGEGVNQAELARRCNTSTSHLSNVLSKSRRCSLYLALKLSSVTNVPIESLVKWPEKYSSPVELS